MLSGRTDAAILLYAILALGFIAAGTDLLCGKIFNWLTIPGVLLGLIASTWIGGWVGLASAALAVVVGFLLYGWMFFFGAMGAGDVKLLMALGAWGGIRFVVETAVLGVFLGGAMAVVMLLLRGRLRDFLERMRKFLMSVFVKELELERPKIDPGLTMPFGIPIAVAAAWVALGHPLAQIGVSLWVP